MPQSLDSIDLQICVDGREISVSVSEAEQRKLNLNMQVEVHTTSQDISVFNVFCPVGLELLVLFNDNPTPEALRYAVKCFQIAIQQAETLSELNAVTCHIQGAYRTFFQRSSAPEEVDGWIPEPDRQSLDFYCIGFGLFSRVCDMDPLGDDAIIWREYLDRAIHYFRRAGDLPSPNTALPRFVFRYLADSLLLRGREADTESDLTVKDMQEAIMAYGRLPEEDINDCVLTNIGDANYSLYGLLGESDYNQSAIKHHELALEKRRSNGDLLGCCKSLIHLGMSHSARFKKSGLMDDIDVAIRCFHDALTSSNNDAFQDLLCYRNLGDEHHQRFLRFGIVDDLHRSMSSYRTALALPNQDDHTRWSCLTELGRVCRQRFSHFGDLKDLEDDVSLHAEAVDIYRHGHPRYWFSVVYYAGALGVHGAFIDSEEELGQAVDMLKSANDPPANPSLTTKNNLANLLMIRYNCLKRRADLDGAIEVLQAVTPLQEPARTDEDWIGSLPQRHMNLAQAYNARFKETACADDHDNAVLHYEASSKSIPEMHPDRSHILRLQATNYQDCINMNHRHGGNIIDARERILEILRTATIPETFRLGERLRSAFAWIDACRLLDGPDLLEAYSSALSILESSITIARALKVQNTKFLAYGVDARVKTLASDSASAAIERGNYKLAVEFLEQGRGLMFANLSKYRTPLDNIRKLDEALAERFAMRSRALERGVISGSATTEPEHSRKDDVGRFHRARKEWNDVVSDIQRLDPTFLARPKYADLQEAATNGPVLLINLSEYRSDIIILRYNEAPTIVNLSPSGSLAALSMQSMTLRRAVAMEVGSRQASLIGTVLLHLWKHIVLPVLSEIGGPSPGEDKRRLWWSPTVSAWFLPFHAAGDYFKGQKLLADTYLSSYTPTLMALIRARRRNGNSQRLSKSLLIVAQPDPPQERKSLKALPQVIQESRAILATGQTFNKTLLLVGRAGGCSAVLEAMEQYSWIHFACHGVQESADAFKSKFWLADGPLTIKDVIENGLPQAEHAFLSACQSAAGDMDDPDNGVHLAAAMMFAGFRSVVGTLWPMDDADGPIVASAFYEHLTVLDPERSAEALLSATQRLRALKASLRRWVCFVHYGI